MTKEPFLKPENSADEQFKIIFDNANDGMLLADIATKKFYLGNNKICHMLGYSHEEIKTLGVNDIHPKKDLPYVLEQFEKQVTRKIALSENMPVQRKDGSVFYADVNTSHVKLAGKTYLLGIFREKSKPGTRENKLIEQNIRDDAVLQSLGDGLIVIVDVDKGGKIAYVNKVFEDITGWKLEEVRNKSVVDIVPREDKDGKPVPFKERIVTKVLAGEKIVADLTDPFFYIRKDKSKFPVASVITPIIVDGKIVGAVETFRDISKEHEADKAKSEFASLVSHQLRTPFATINWYIELLLSEDAGKLNDKQKQYLGEAYHASKRMVNLVNILLSISRIETGTTIIDAKPTDIVSLAEILIKENALQIQKKKLKVETAYDKNIPKILADPKQLSMVLQNLLSNAIKYTPAGGKITIEIRLKGDEVAITVKDTGMGVPESARPYMFTRFFRADNAKENEPEGAGLGLYILKSIIDQMKGKIWFESQENKGATFYVTVPIKYHKDDEINKEKEHTI